MYVITVIPIQRGIGKETLSYFTSSQVELGSLVNVPLRSKTIDALVVASKDARMMKGEIKSATFSLRKIDKIISKPFLSEAFMKTVDDVAKYHAATTGAVLNVLLPKKLLITQNTFSEGKTHPYNVGHCNYKGNLNERIHHYQKLISKNPQTVIIVPTKERQQTFKKIFPATPILLPSSLIEIPLDTSTIIIEDAKSNSYKSISRPFIDFRYTLKKYAEEIGASILEGDTTIQPEVKKVLEEHKKEEHKTYSSLGKSLEKAVDALSYKPSHLFILGTRKGHSGTLVCQDCKHTLMCTACNAPLTLHLKKEYEEYNSLLCHHCGHKETALRPCANCRSWKLKAFGLGIEKIEEDVKEVCKKNKAEVNIKRIDSTLKLTPKKIREMIADHYAQDYSVLIATELALPYLVEASLENKKNDISFIASLDSLLALPDFSINEKIWRLGCMLDEITKSKVVIQTKNTSHPLLSDWEKSDEKGFYEKEIAERKQFNYPPFHVFIKLSISGNKEKIGKEMKKVEHLLSKWKPLVFPAFIKSIKNQHTLHALISIPKEKWVDEELLETLLSLPPFVTINVNPVSLL